MVRLLDKSKISAFNYFYMLCMMVYLGHATIFARSLGDVTTLGNAFALIITAVLISKNKIKFKTDFYISIVVFLLYAAITVVNNGLLNPLWIAQWLIWITIAYCICSTFREKMFVVFETLMCSLCIVSLFFWVIHCLSPGTMRSIAELLEFSKPFQEDGNVGVNMLLYTVGAATELSEFSLIQRNAGFAWEPGAFASYICLAIFCNSLRRNFSLKGNKALVVFIFTLLTTQSTTGMVTLAVMLLLWMIIRGKIWLSILIFPVLLMMTQLPFVSEKILAEYGNLELFDLNRFSSTDTYALGRMMSLVLYLEEFLRHPLWGLGGWTGGTWLQQAGYDNIALISGVGEILAMYGAVMTLVFVICLLKSANFISKTLKSKNAYLIIVAIFGMMFSYSMWRHPMYISFWLYGLYGATWKNPRTVLT